MNQRRNKKPHGQLRQGQVVTTFGPGAMLDMPNHSVLIAGLEHWKGISEEIPERRLADKLCRLLDLPSIRLYAPPPDQEDPTATTTGIAGWQFPEWFIVQESAGQDGASASRSRMLVHRSALTSGKYIDQNKKRRTVVPVRFVRACRNGHIGDIDWRAFVHSGPSSCKRRLFLDIQRGPGDTTLASMLVSRFAERFVKTQWPADRPLPEVFYDPRSLDLAAQERSALHAKCIVVDGRELFISSANFTEAAQNRNLEVGLLVRSASIAERLVRHFDTLVAQKGVVADYVKLPE